MRLHTLLLAGSSLRAEEVRQEALDFDVALVTSQAEALERLRLVHQEDQQSSLLNLPGRNTSFVGRQLELSEVTNLLGHNECRLLSVVGVGGVGKTRLALQAAHQQLENGGFVDGVVFVPLEALTDTASIPAVVAGALGLDLSGGEDAGSVVVRFLAEKRLLLVLDNFEQLLEGISFVRELIDRCPGLKLLITTRERLNLEAEWVFEVEGLTYPDEASSVERAAHFDAVQLFLQRARQAHHGFSLTQETLPAVMRICRLVEGMPLAIELAARWLRALPVGDIAGELGAGFDLLESPGQDVPERHRSVRVVFDHSWGLLSEGEREVHRRLSVFRGGFRREAAAEVAGATLPMLARLVDESLLRISSEGRYDRHPLLTQYTSEKLAEQKHEQEEAEQKHGTYYLGLVRKLEPHLWTLKRKEAFRVFLEELANIRAAWDWAASNLKVQEIEHTTPVMFDFFQFRLSEGLEYFGTTNEFFGSIAERLDENNPSHAAALGTLLIHQVFFAFIMHRDRDRDRQREQSLAERGVSLLETLGEPRALAKGYHTLAPRADLSSAEAMEGHERALAVARKHRSASDIYHVLWLVGFHLLMRNTDPAQLKQFVDDALEELRALNHLPGVAQFLVFSGHTLEFEQRLGEAKGLFLEAYGLAEELEHHEIAINALWALSRVSIDLGEVDQAAGYAQNMYRRVEETGLRFMLSDALFALAGVALARGDLGGARELMSRAFEIELKRGDGVRIRNSLSYWAELLVAEGNLDLAVVLFAFIVGDRFVQNESHSSAERALAELEGSMTPEEFSEAVERGRKMTLEDVVDEIVA